jgi:hypothetical protein
MGPDPKEEPMTTVPAMNDPNQPRKAIKTKVEMFNLVPMTLVWTTDGVYGLYDSFADIIGDTQAKSNLLFKCVLIAFPSGGQEEVRRFVRVADFLAAGAISTKNVAFRDFLAGFVEQALDKGFSIAPDLVDDPDMQQWAVVGRAMAKSARAEREAIEAKQLALESKQEIKSLEDHVDNLTDIYEHGRKWRIAMVALGQRGIKIPVNMRSTVGIEIAAVGRRLGYPVDTYINGKKSKYPPKDVGDFFPLHYPIPVIDHILDVWIRENKNNPERSRLFNNMR